MLFCPVIVVVDEGCPCGPNCSISPGHRCTGRIKLPNGDTTLTLYSFVLLHKAAEALSSFLLFPDCLPGSQVHRDYFFKDLCAIYEGLSSQKLYEIHWIAIF